MAAVSLEYNPKNDKKVICGMIGINKSNMKEKLGLVLPWLCIGIIGFVFIFFYDYVDQSNTVRQSIIFMNEIIKGNFTGGYQAVLDMVGTPGNWDILAIYEPFAYIILGVFSFPIVLLYHFGMIDLPLLIVKGQGDRWFDLFVKMQQLFLIGGTAVCIYKICQALGMDKKDSRKGILYFASGTSFLFYALAIGQMEIYVVFFSMLGILFWLKKEHKKFLFFFSLAIPIKMFALLIFFPLCFIREKRVWKILVDFLGGCSVWIVLKLLFHTDVAYRLSIAEPNQRMLGTIFSKQIAGGNSSMSELPIFVMIYILICLCVYFIKSDGLEDYLGVYIPFVIYAFLFSFVGHYPYWIVLITPFLPVLMVYDSKKRDGNMLIATMVGICYNIVTVFVHTQFMSYTRINDSCMPFLFGRRELSEVPYETLAQMLHNSPIEKMLPAFNAFYVAGLLWLVAYNLPIGFWKNKIVELKMKGVVYLRILAIVPFLVLTFGLYYSTKDISLVNTSENVPMTAGWNLVSEESKEFGKNVLTQEVSFDNNYELTRMKLFFKRNGSVYSAYCSLNVQFVDLSNNEVLYSKRVGHNELAWEEFTIFDLKKIKVEPNRRYEIRIYPEDAQDAYPIYICLTENDVLPGSNAEYMGGDSGHDLYMVIEGKTQE